ncbi:hypothetical protein CONLIGDRAFT_709693 [Coniochaeta ligniaria NRRL 30616]|uniref:Nephrocystin 3-like N-terminal domain-containing protein n=1 Tax=Coniochaeta ligniaria NRRL 30616 TaxID=1408157 RepID=A0A1J7J2J9_9PEZI|nr:hypothetical protein CONLIGDRAFT_709693 [Coniochaeta ligniaria NRRL 30616]
MDPFSALAIAAAVVQFADIGAKLVNKAWLAYRTTTPDNEEEKFKDQLAQVTRELSFLINGIEDASTTLPSPEIATPAQAQLLQICSECYDVATEFSHVIDRIRNRLDEKTRSASKARASKGTRQAEQAGSKIGSRGLSAFRPWKGSDPEKDNLSRVTSKMHQRLQYMRHRVFDSVVLCLWEDSKRTKQWELHFSKQLDALTGLIGRVDETTRRIRQEKEQQTLTMDEEDFDTQHMQRTEFVCHDLEHLIQKSRVGIYSDVDTPSDRLSASVLPLAQASQTISLPEIGSLMISFLSTPRTFSDAKAKHLREELTNFLWQKEWKLDAELAASTAVSCQTVALAISEDGGFDTIQTRESAVVNSFDDTCSWILQENPKMQDDKPMWDSFPGWLTDDHSTSRFYWITGKPASGKSTMMKFLLRNPHLRPLLGRWAEPLPLLVVSYYAWQAGSSLQKSFEGLKRTIICQALKLRPELAPIVAPRRWALFQVLKAEPEFPEWLPWEIEESFAAFLSECGKSFRLVLFIDGLDEFAVPASQVVELFKDIERRCGPGLKACVASRPWTEFDDAYNDSPMLEMHRLTRDDMMAFVRGKFQGHKGFIEQRHLYPAATDDLLTDIVDKADGVWLWVSVVVAHLLGLFASGRSTANLKQVLTALPPDLSSLYDTIWATIQADHLSDACWMMQVVRAVDGPVHWFTMWMIEEGQAGPIDVNAFRRDTKYKGIALKSMGRKLSARTKGILELSWSDDKGTGYINFIHRTAWAWVQQPEVWQRVCASSPESFNPFLVLVEAETTLLSDDKAVYMTSTEIWTAVTRTLWYASEASDNPENEDNLVRLLDSFDTVLGRLDNLIPGRMNNVFQSSSSNKHWACAYASSLIGLASQFSILPYIRNKSLSDRTQPHHQSFSNSGGLLEYAIFGYHSYFPSAARQIFCPEVPRSRRLATVQFLLDQGVVPTRMRNLKGKMASNWQEDTEYFTKVADGGERVSKAASEAFAHQHGYLYAECSALTGEGVREAFAMLVEHTYAGTIAYEEDPSRFQMSRDQSLRAFAKVVDAIYPRRTSV